MEIENSSKKCSKQSSEEQVKDEIFNKFMTPRIEKINGVFSDECFKEFINELWKNRNEVYETYDMNKRYDNRLENIAIILNNKIIEVANYFKKHNLNFYEELEKTSLARTIFEDLLSYYELGFVFLDNSFRITQKASDLPEEFENAEQAIEFYNDIIDLINCLTKYQNTTNKLWNYNFEKNVFSSIINEYYDFDDKTKYDERVKIYIAQLSSMGLKKQAKEITDYFEKVLKKQPIKVKILKKEKTIDGTVEKDKETRLFEIYGSKISKTRNLIKNLKLKDQKLDNAGILLNNKVVELVHIYKNKGKDFYEFSTLVKLMLKILDDDYKSAYMALKNDDITKYKEYCKKIYNFSIEKVLIPYFECEPDANWNKKHIERFYSCKNEIEDLGFKKKAKDIEGR